MLSLRPFTFPMAQASLSISANVSDYQVMNFMFGSTPRECLEVWVRIAAMQDLEVGSNVHSRFEDFLLCGFSYIRAD